MFSDGGGDMASRERRVRLWAELTGSVALTDRSLLVLIVWASLGPMLVRTLVTILLRMEQMRRENVGGATSDWMVVEI